MDCFSCLADYDGKIHLVYGEFDRYVSESLRKKTIQKVKEKGDTVMTLPGQDHSPWEYKICLDVYKNEIKFLKKYLS